VNTSILLIAPEVAADPVAAALRCELEAEVELATTRRAGLAALRRREYTLVLLEDSLASADPEAAELIYQAAGATPALEIHCVLSSAERIVHQVRSALLRRNRDRTEAAAAATERLQHELGATLTGILLESQLALREANPTLQPKLRHLVEMASTLCERLRA
jgi:signal transduction histidine kinase